MTLNPTKFRENKVSYNVYNKSRKALNPTKFRENSRIDITISDNEWL